MKTSKNAARTLTVDPAFAHEPDVDIASYSAELHSDDAAETEAGPCLVCYDLLVRHEQACAAGPSLLPAGAEAAIVVASLPVPAATFPFAVGHHVQPSASAPAVVTWCGQFKGRHPATGLVQCINVYRLDNGHWNCYRVDELQAA